MQAVRPKQVVWMGDSLDRLRQFPREVQHEIGHAVYLAQIGEKHFRAKPLKGLGPGVLEVLSDFSGNTYRAVYTVRLATRIFVLHVFQKKSKKGISTPRQEIELVRQRLNRAAEIHSALEADHAS
ncbi:MAG TPA: type II toxin-antitoxin system RelE/ParE family toxin [Candidatus Acidoferrales bacterium]|nr:type II toxin-antitoxin system RelE/ParE family toxin [Candidatus Acidoferrales bacterium]